MDKPRRSPGRVALLTFLAVLGIGMVGSLTFLSVTGRLSDHPHERGEAAGRGIFTLAAIGAAVGYFVQRGRTR